MFTESLQCVPELAAKFEGRSPRRVASNFRRVLQPVFRTVYGRFPSSSRISRKRVGCSRKLGGFSGWFSGSS